MKKLVSLVIVMALVLSLAVGASAANDGKITVSNAISGQTYNIYRIFDLTYDNKGDTDSTNDVYSYTINNKWANFFATNADGASYITDTVNNYPISVTENGTTATKYIQITNENAAAFAAAARNFVTSNSIVHDGTQTASSTSVEFTALAYGYYLLDTTTGTLCSLDSTSTTVTIDDKNTAPILSKKVSTSSNGTFAESVTANIGDDIYFEVIITAGKGAVGYVLHDNMADSFTNYTDLKVQYQEKNGNTYSDMAVSTDYTTATSNSDGCDFEITISKPLNEGDQVRVSYKTTLDTDAVIAGDGNKNTAKLKYGESATAQMETTEASAKVMTYALAINKTDKEGINLADAKFSLSNGTTTLYFTKDSNNVYTYAGTTTGEGKTTALVSFVTDDNDNEVILIKGLNVGTYTLTETAEPAGYNKLTAPVSVNITANGTNAATYYVTYTNGVVSNSATTATNATGEKTITIGQDAQLINVINLTGTELPSTGGVGTTIFYVLGGLMFVGALVLLVTNKRMKAE